MQMIQSSESTNILPVHTHSTLQVYSLLLYQQLLQVTGERVEFDVLVNISERQKSADRAFCVAAPPCFESTAAEAYSAL